MRPIRPMPWCLTHLVTEIVCVPGGAVRVADGGKVLNSLFYWTRGGRTRIAGVMFIDMVID